MGGIGAVGLTILSKVGANDTGIELERRLSSLIALISISTLVAVAVVYALAIV